MDAHKKIDFFADFKGANLAINTLLRYTENKSRWFWYIFSMEGGEEAMSQYEYEFERIETDFGTGYSLFGGVKVDTEGHREIILRRAADGWRYVGFIPTSQRGTGHIEEMDLVFERILQER